MGAFDVFEPGRKSHSGAPRQPHAAPYKDYPPTAIARRTPSQSHEKTSIREAGSPTTEEKT